MRRGVISCIPATSKEGVTEQGTLMTFTCVEWVCRMILKKVAHYALEIADCMMRVEPLEEWVGEVEEQYSQRTEREERQLQRLK
jgi:hypothetical protein